MEQTVSVFSPCAISLSSLASFIIGKNSENYGFLLKYKYFRRRTKVNVSSTLTKNNVAIFVFTKRFVTLKSQKGFVVFLNWTDASPGGDILAYIRDVSQQLQNQ